MNLTDLNVTKNIIVFRVFSQEKYPTSPEYPCQRDVEHPTFHFLRKFDKRKVFAGEKPPAEQNTHFIKSSYAL